MQRGIFRGMSTAAVCLCLLAATAWLSAVCSKNEGSTVTGRNMSEIKITIAGKDFTAVPANTPAAAEFLKRLPLTLRMNELNGNEKYAGLPDRLPADSADILIPGFGSFRSLFADFRQLICQSFFPYLRSFFRQVQIGMPASSFSFSFLH